MGPEPMETNTSNQIEQIFLKNTEYHHQCSFEQHIPALHGRRCPAGLSLGRACAQPTSAPHPTVITREGCDVIAELPEHAGKNTSKHFEQIIGIPSCVLSGSTSQPGKVCGTQLRWAMPVQDQLLPNTKSNSPVKV